ncbi:serine-threonine protein kinase, putative [Bodo saltans]|uniref:non-specific serine/threonine protein kinase n=1 Tax=Bodo saltans TaxID=75058 RepID=A0A0S4IQF8_BODSA|nr:serine-threonine protein kinase, putative [Bodo saltans]|eukprot:CUF21853.1 serine-threonine protein kinase, putative [Bodo saltans]
MSHDTRVASGSATIGNIQLLTKLQSQQPQDQVSKAHDVYIARLRDSSTRDDPMDSVSERSLPSSSAATGAVTFVVARIFPLESLFLDERLRLKLERHQLVLRAANHRHILRSWPAVYTPTDLVTVEEFCEFGEVFEVVEKHNEDAQMRELEQANQTDVLSSSTSANRTADAPDRFSPDGLPTAVVLRLFDELMQAVAHCHDVLGICHRDIKLEHLLLDRSMSLKLTSFGMAAALPDRQHLSTSLQSKSSSALAIGNSSSDDRLLHVACGSRHYVAPEILAGLAYDGAAADVFSCGIVLYALVTGGFPLEDDANVENSTINNGANNEITASTLPKLASFQRIRDEAVRDLLRGMLNPDPSLRWTVTQIQQLWSRLRRARRTDASQQNQFRY